MRSGRTVLLPLSAFYGDLKRRLRCDGCGREGRADISVVWASYSARRG